MLYISELIKFSMGAFVVTYQRPICMLIHINSVVTTISTSILTYQRTNIPSIDIEKVYLYRKVLGDGIVYIYIYIYIYTLRRGTL